jgi:hypothetical protein
MSRCAPRRKIGRSPVPETARSSYDGKGVRATPPCFGERFAIILPREHRERQEPRERQEHREPREPRYPREPR